MGDNGAEATKSKEFAEQRLKDWGLDEAPTSATAVEVRRVAYEAHDQCKAELQAKNVDVSDGQTLSNASSARLRKRWSDRKTMVAGLVRDAALRDAYERRLRRDEELAEDERRLKEQYAEYYKEQQQLKEHLERRDDKLRALGGHIGDE